MKCKTRFDEADIKTAFLDNRELFGDIGDSCIVYEKAICQGNTIMDVLMCTEKMGVIGVEIKTERDSTQRLNKQLKDYEKVCDYVYVLCHDNHLEKVEGIIKRYQHNHVGVISYVDFKGKPMFGVYRRARVSPYKDVYHTLNILWKSEILTLLGTFRFVAKRIENEKGIPSASMERRQKGISGGIINASAYTSKTRKSTLINQFIAKVGRVEANKIFCDIFINHRNHPDKAIKLRHFNTFNRTKSQ